MICIIDQNSYNDIQRKQEVPLSGSASKSADIIGRQYKVSRRRKNTPKIILAIGYHAHVRTLVNLVRLGGSRGDQSDQKTGKLKWRSSYQTSGSLLHEKFNSPVQHIIQLTTHKFFHNNLRLI